ncbi:MAG: hypothetical protein FGF48_06775, partial [Candidatus Brockarchaeota archaeon]|nr:hypothetical protein [Candidatus Brockarchaeota archaeon]
EAEEYVKNVELEIIGFCNSISNSQLAGEVEDLLRHILDTLGPNAADWLLELLRDVYSKALVESNDNRDYADANLRSVVEKVFKYPESKLHSCRLASVKIPQLMELQRGVLMKLVEEILSSESGEVVVYGPDKIKVFGSGYIELRGKFEKGLYLIVVKRMEDEKVFKWSTRKEETGDFSLTIPKRFRDELKGKEVEITIIKYDYSSHFRSEGPNFSFSPMEGLIVDGREIEIGRPEPRPWSVEHRTAMTVKLAERSIDGVEVYLVFYEDGDVSVTFGGKGTLYGVTSLRIEGEILIIEYNAGSRVYKAIVPLIIEKWEVGRRYDLYIRVEKREGIGMVKELRKLFGYYNTEELRQKIEEGELKIVACFDNGRFAICGTGKLTINVPEGAEVLEYIVIHKPSYSEELSDEDVRWLKNASTVARGNRAKDMARMAIEAGKLAGLEEMEFVDEEIEIGIKGEKGVIDLVFKTKNNRLAIVEVESTIDPNYISDCLKKGANQLKDYKRLIEKYGIDLSGKGLGIMKAEDIEAYVVVYVFFDLKNKKVEMGFTLPKLST